MAIALQAPKNAAALSRKIIYDGEVDLIVKDVDPVGKQVVTLVQERAATSPSRAPPALPARSARCAGS